MEIHTVSPQYLARTNLLQGKTILVTGAGKRAAILGWRAGERLPIANIGGPAQVDVLLDKAAQA